MLSSLSLDSTRRPLLLFLISNEKRSVTSGRNIQNDQSDYSIDQINTYDVMNADNIDLWWKALLGKLITLLNKDPMSILKKPLVTEKVSAMNEKGKYGFIVDRNCQQGRDQECR